jgi:hypothetical protein
MAEKCGTPARNRMMLGDEFMLSLSRRLARKKGRFGRTDKGSAVTLDVYGARL